MPHLNRIPQNEKWPLKRIAAVLLVFSSVGLAILGAIWISSPVAKRQRLPGTGASNKIAHYTDAIQKDSRNSDAYVRRAFVYWEQSELNKALSDFSDAIRLKPYDGSILFARGEVNYIIGDYDAAVRDLNEAERLLPESLLPSNSQRRATLVSTRGRASVRLGKVREAIEDLTEAIRLNPNDYEAYESRGSARQAIEDLQGAIDDFSQSISLNASNFIAYHNRGNSYKRAGELEKAIKDYTEAIRLAPRITDPIKAAESPCSRPPSGTTP